MVLMSKHLYENEEFFGIELEKNSDTIDKIS
jgi:hypothetical protein